MPPNARLLVCSILRLYASCQEGCRVYCETILLSQVTNELAALIDRHLDCGFSLIRQVGASAGLTV